MRMQFLKILLVLLGIMPLMSCEHTFSGMKQDIREDTSNPPPSPPHTQTTVIKRTEVVYPPSDLPTSPPPLQAPQ